MKPHHHTTTPPPRPQTESAQIIRRRLSRVLRSRQPDSERHGLRPIGEIVHSLFAAPNQP